MTCDSRNHVHALIDQLPPMLDPLSRKRDLAPIDDERFTEEDRFAVAEADGRRKHKAPIPLDRVLADFRLTMADYGNARLRR